MVSTAVTRSLQLARAFSAGARQGLVPAATAALTSFLQLVPVFLAVARQGLVPAATAACCNELLAACPGLTWAEAVYLPLL